MRVLLSYMNKIDGCYFYKDKLFSGVGFEIDNEKNVTAYEMEQGKVIKPYQSVYQMNGREFRQVDITEGMTDYHEVAYFKGQNYSGIGFEFDDEFCTTEVFIVNSIVLAEAYWHSNGTLLSFATPNPYLGEIYKWFSDGGIKKIQIDKTGYGYIAINFREDDAITFFTADSPVFKFFNEIHILALFFPYTESKDLCKAHWSENVRLAGDAINDDFINMMIESGSWNHVTKLDLINANIKNPVFSKLKNIQQLCLNKGNRQIHEAIERQLKQERPDVSVSIDGYLG